MRLRTVTGLIALLVCLGASWNSAEAQVPAPWVQGAAPGGYVVDQTAMQQSNPSDPFGTRYRLYSEFGDGVGFQDGQTYVNVFHPLHIDPYVDLVFFDGRIFGGHEDDVYGGNFGIGYRRVLGPAVAGVSGWVDAVSLEETHSRLGVSAEFVLPYLELRANGYFGLGDQSRDLASIASGTPTFSANQIVFASSAMSEFQYDGFDAEIGGPIPGLPNVNAYFGGYYIETDDGQDSGGFRFRAEAHVNRNVQVGLQVSDDSIFDTNVFGTVALTLPSGAPSTWWSDGFFRGRDSVDQLARPVSRQYRIPVETRVRSESVAAVNPADGDPFFVIHIDPSRSGGGDGTFENPFGQNAFVNNPNADIIRVLPGTLSTNGEITLANTQRLLAATRSHLVTTQSRGTFTLPDQRTGTVTLTNVLGGNTVVLANNNEVSGFSFTGTGVGISGSNIAGYNLNNNTFTGLTTGIQLVNATTGSPALVDSSTFTGNGTGLLVTSTAGGVSTVNATNNTFSNNTGSGIQLEATGGLAAGAATTLTANVDGNTFSGNGNMGVRAVGSGVNSTLNVNVGVNSANTSTGDVDAGFGVIAQGSSVVNADIRNNTVSGTTDNAATTGPVGDGIYFERSGQSVLTASVGGVGTGNTSTGNAGHGMRVQGSGGNQVSRVTFQGNTFSGNALDGVGVDLTGDSIFVFTNEQNTFASNTRHGLRITSSANSAVGDPFTFNAASPTTSASVFDGDTFTGNGADGINLSAADQSWHNIVISGVSQRTTISGSGGDGIQVANASTPTVNGNNPTVNFYTIQGTDISGSGGDGMEFRLTGGESASIPGVNVERFGGNTVNIGGAGTGQDVTITGNGDQGIDIVTAHSDTGNVGGVLTTFSVAGTDTVNIDSTTSSNNGSDGVQVTTSLLSSVNLTMVRSTLSNNTGIGFEGLVTDINNASVFNIGSNVAGTGNVISGNGLQGVYLQTLSPVAAGGDANDLPVIANTFLSPDAGAAPLQVAQTDVTSGLYSDIRNVADFRFVTARFNVFGNTITNNGLPSNAADGMVLSVGTNTRMIAAVSGNTFGGNEGNDLNIVNVVSQNPGTSIDNITAGPNVDLLYADPLGELDLALGFNFAGVDPPVAGEVPSGSNPNTGVSFAISTIGLGGSLAGRTENGLFTNTDTVSGVTIKPANRHSFMIVRVYDTAPSGLDNNTFPITGSVTTTLLNANQNIGGGGLGIAAIPTFDTITNLVNPGNIFVNPGPTFVTAGTAFP